MPATVSRPDVWPMASTPGRARDDGSRVAGDGRVDEGHDRPGRVAVSRGVEQGGRHGGGGTEPGADGIRHRVTAVERAGHEQRTGEGVVAGGGQPGPAPDEGPDRRPDLGESGAQVAALATT